MLQRAASSAYSWWWASHIRTKQSKWLEQNLQDMEDKVGSMLNIIDEDGDSFARRAEMYYRKRPELVHLVEESFRAYRALAERYDHISRDLQSANRTIATVYPEKVHFSAMEDEDDEEHGFSKKLAKPEDNAASKPPIPKVPMKSFKPLPTLRTKRAQQKQLKKTRSSAKAVPCSGLSKGKALEEIDKQQKGILALQTEKEFVKSSYENAIAKYLEIENRINEMQVKVCGLQDEFGIGTVIEDNEARKLMASSALKSCQETLNRLKEKQERLVNEASIERGKIKEAQQKLQAFKDGFYGEQSDKQELEEINKLPSEYQSVTNPDHMAHALQSFEGNSKELEDVDGNNSLTVIELVDKIDDVVDRVVNLETDVASSTAMVQRLRSEAGELQEHVQALEKTVEGSDIVRQKMVKLEIEMARVMSLNRTVEDQNISLSTHFAQASYSLDQIAEKVENSKFNEIGEIAGWNVAGNDDSAGNHLKTPERRKGDKFLNVVSQLLSTSSDQPQASKSLDADKKGESSESVGQGHENIMLAANGLCVSEELELEQKRSDELLGVSEGCEASCTQGVETVEIIRNAKSGEVGKDGEDLGKLMNDKLSKSSPEDAVQLGVLQREQIVENEVQPVKLILPEAAEDDGMQYPLSVHDKCHDVDESCVEHRSDDLEEKQNEIKFKLESEEPSIPAPNANTVSVSDSLPEHQEKEKLKLEPSAAIGGGSGSRWRKLLEDAEGELDWRRLFLSGLEDREKFLVDEYTSVINKLKETRRKLSEVEKKNKAGLTDQASKMKQILHVNSLKDKEIQSLRRTMSLLMMNTGEKDAIPLPGTSQSEQNEEAKLEEPELLLSSDLGQGTANDAIENTVEDTQPARLEINLNDELHFVSSLEEKFRSDLDEMLGENLEFWLRFCTSVHQIQKFQSSIEDLQIEAAQLMESKKQGTNTKNLESLKSDAKPIYKHLKEIQYELNLWLQHNSLLKEELESRHSSLTDIQEDITRLSNATEDSELSEYQAAKFQGEVANMKQENNKVADELQSCLGRVRSLHTDIDRTLVRLNKEFGICESERKHSRSRIPLRTFLFGVRLKKQKQSFFRCISPSLQKQYSDLASQFPPSR